MHIVITIAVILGFCLVLLFGLLSVLQDLFARGVHQHPAVPEPETERHRQHEATGVPRSSQTG